MLVTVLLSIVLLTTDQRSHSLDNFRSALSFVVYPIQVLVNLPSTFKKGLTESVVSYGDLVEANKKLKQQQLTNKTKLLKLAALEKENIRLRAVLENSFKLGEQFLIAELLSVNLVPFENIVVVNKGTRFGVHPKQPVLDVDGVVGQVIRALPLSSEIMMITDPNHAIPVQVNRNGLRTIAVGSGQLNQLSLPFLPNNADIEPGDLLISSGLGGTFPLGYPVAVVDTVEPQPDKPFANIYATPKAKLNQNRELLIVWSNSAPIQLATPATAETPKTPETNQAADQDATP